jgi:hypothetical protein
MAGVRTGTGSAPAVDQCQVIYPLAAEPRLETIAAVKLRDRD